MDCAAGGARARSYVRTGAFGRQRQGRAGASLRKAALELLLCYQLRVWRTGGGLLEAELRLHRRPALLGAHVRGALLDHRVQSLRALLLHRPRGRCQVFVFVYYTYYSLMILLVHIRAMLLYKVLLRRVPNERSNLGSIDSLRRVAPVNFT